MSAVAVDNVPDKQALKVTSGALVRAVGGVEAAAGYCRANFRRLSEYGRFDNDCFMPVDVIADLEAISHGTAGYPLVTRDLARRAGFTLVALPLPGEISGTSIHAALAEAVREFNDVSQRLIEALGDGKCDAAEAAALTLQCTEAAEAVLRLRAMLERIVEQG